MSLFAIIYKTWISENIWYKLQISKLIYDCLNGYAPVQFNAGFTQNTQMYYHHTRSHVQFENNNVISTTNLCIPFTRTSPYGNNSIKVLFLKIWNEITNNITAIKSKIWWSLGGHVTALKYCKKYELLGIVADIFKTNSSTRFKLGGMTR